MDTRVPGRLGGPRCADRVRTRDRQAGRPHPLGRHRDRVLLARLHGRCGAIRRTSGCRDRGCLMRGRSTTAVVGLWCLLAGGSGGAVASAGAVDSGRTKGDVRVFAKVPAPGYPALTLVTPHGTVYVSTFTGVRGGTPGPSKGFAYSSAGKLTRTYTVRGQSAGADHAVQVAERDRRGRLYLLDQKPSRV